MRFRRPIPKDVQKKVRTMFGGRCAYCGGERERLQIDHKVPLEQNGTDDIDNLFPACGACNNYKNRCDIEDMRRWLKEVPRIMRQTNSIYLAEATGVIAVTGNDPVFYFETAVTNK